jgi:hypothetical protein
MDRWRKKRITLSREQKVARGSWIIFVQDYRDVRLGRPQQLQLLAKKSDDHSTLTFDTPIRRRYSIY